MKRFLFIILAITSFVTAQATPQARDVLFWHGNKYFIFPFIDVESRMNADELKNLNRIKTSDPPTAIGRGYSLEFEITNDTLYLTAIKDAKNYNLMESVLGNLYKRPLLDFSDTLYLGYGNSFNDNVWWTLVYESEITVAFQNGVVQWMKDNKNKSKYSRYDHNDLLFSEYIYCNTRWNELNEQTMQTKPIVQLRYDIDTLGRIAEIRILKSSGYLEFDEEAIRVMKSIPGFSVSFVKGEYIPHSYDYSFIFDLERVKSMGSFSNYKQYDNQLLRLLEESIVETKIKYISFSKNTSRNIPLYLCSDGLPSPILEQNKPFYESIGIDNISLYNQKKSQLEVEEVMDIIETRYYLKGNIVEIYVHIITVTEKNDEMLLAYWFDDVDKYVYEYSCETNEWRLKE